MRGRVSGTIIQISHLGPSLSLDLSRTEPTHHCCPDRLPGDSLVGRHRQTSQKHSNQDPQHLLEQQITGLLQYFNVSDIILTDPNYRVCCCHTWRCVWFGLPGSPWWEESPPAPPSSSSNWRHFPPASASASPRLSRWIGNLIYHDTLQYHPHNVSVGLHYFWTLRLLLGPADSVLRWDPSWPHRR